MASRRATFAVVKYFALFQGEVKFLTGGKKVRLAHPRASLQAREPHATQAYG